LCTKLSWILKLGNIKNVNGFEKEQKNKTL
jgi:hypothetical protein